MRLCSAIDLSGLRLGQVFTAMLSDDAQGKYSLVRKRMRLLGFSYFRRLQESWEALFVFDNYRKRLHQCIQFTHGTTHAR